MCEFKHFFAVILVAGFIPASKAASLHHDSNNRTRLAGVTPATTSYMTSNGFTKSMLFHNESRL